MEPKNITFPQGKRPDCSFEWSGLFLLSKYTDTFGAIFGQDLGQFIVSDRYNRTRERLKTGILYFVDTFLDKFKSCHPLSTLLPFDTHPFRLNIAPCCMICKLLNTFVIKSYLTNNSSRRIVYVKVAQQITFEGG